MICTKCVDGMLLDDQRCDKCHGTGHVAELRHLEMRPGYGIDMAVAHPVVAIMADHLVKMFDDHGGANYVETSMWHPERGEFVMIVQRKAGKTPHQLKVEAEAKLAKVERRYLWRPIADMHEDYSYCAVMNIHDAGAVSIAHVCNLDFSERCADEGWTHFSRIAPLTIEQAEKLIAEMEAAVEVEA